MRVTLIHNAGAGAEDHAAAALEETVASAGHRVRYQDANDPGWRRAFEWPTDLVVAAGGDGTVHDVFIGLAGRDIPGAVLPLGSANNIARALGLDGVDAGELARAWHDCPRRPYDVGTLGTDAAPPVSFVESVGGGLFAQAIADGEAEEDPRTGDDKRRRGLELLARAIEREPARGWVLDLDGVDLSGSYIAVEAVNLREIGPNLPLAPDADPGDGLLDVVVAGADDRRALGAWIDARLRGRTAPAPSLTRARGSVLGLRRPRDCPMHVDDEPASAPPDDAEATVRMGPQRLPVLVPVVG